MYIYIDASLFFSFIFSHYSLKPSLLTRTIYFRYKKAYESVKACPITFNHPSEAQQLMGVGPKLCDRLTEKMKDYCKSNGLPMPKVNRKGIVFILHYNEYLRPVKPNITAFLSG